MVKESEMTADKSNRAAHANRPTNRKVKTKGELKMFPGAKQQTKAAKAAPKAGGKKFVASKAKDGKPTRNHFTMAEDRRLDRIREQNERKADKEAKKLLAKKEHKRKLKILSKKNSKGQPIMGGRIELLLEKIEKRVTG